MVELLRLNLLPTGYIYPKAQRFLRNLIKKKELISTNKDTKYTQHVKYFLRQTGKQITGSNILKLNADNLELYISDLNTKH